MLQKTIFLLLIVLISCQDSNKEKKPEYYYGVLEIVIKNYSQKERIGIIEDTCRYHKTIFDTIHFKKYKTYPSISHKFILTKSEANELYSLFKDIIVNPTDPKNTVSCYAGDNVSFIINSYGNPSTSCSYKSIDGWQETSKSIKRIYDLTLKRVYRRIKI